MPEQHVFNHALRQGCTIQADKRTGAAGGRFMQDTGEHLFTRAGRAGQQGGDFGLRHPLRQHQQLLTHRIGKNKRLWLRLDWRHQRLHVGPAAHIPVIRSHHVLGTVAHGGHR